MVVTYFEKKYIVHDQGVVYTKLIIVVQRGSHSIEHQGPVLNP
jgi:hypothetical protein